MKRYKSKYTEKLYLSAQTAKSYNKKISNRFEAFIWKLEQACLNDILSRYLKRRKIRYLDFACGSGRVLAFIEPYANNSTGIDTSKSMLSEARKITRAKLIRGNIVDNNNLVKGNFDLITAFRLFLNLENHNRALILEALNKKLSKRGCLVINNHMNRYSFVGFQFWIRRLLGAELVRENPKKA
jgi:SAM-dependent methyltransferase